MESMPVAFLTLSSFCCFIFTSVWIESLLYKPGV
jgi:hypothetical protein